MSYEEEDTCMSYEEEDTFMSYEEEDTCMSYEEEDICMSYEEEDNEEEDTCMSYEEEDTCMSYEEEDTCMSYEEEDTCLLVTRRRRASSEAEQVWYSCICSEKEMAACGGNSIVAVTEDGEILAWRHGNLGLGAVLHQQEPAPGGLPPGFFVPTCVHIRI
jgi:hypothetical protein